MSEDTDTMSQMLVESRKKTTQIVTAAVIGFFVLVMFIYGAVKFYPVSSELTRLVDSVGDLESQANEYGPVNVTVSRLSEELQRVTTKLDALAERVTKDEEVDEKLRLVIFPESLQAINTELVELRDIAGDAAGDLERLKSDVINNTQDHVNQKHRANTRAGERLVRDGNIARNTGRIDELEGISEAFFNAMSNSSVMEAKLDHLEAQLHNINQWRSTLQVGREEILQGQIQAVQAEISAIKAQLQP